MKIFIASTSLHQQYGGPAFSVASLAHALAEAGVETGLWAADRSIGDATLPLRTGVRLLEGSESEALAAFGKPDLLHDNGIWLRHNHLLASVAVEKEIPRLVSTRGMLEPWAFAHKRWKKRLAWRAYQERDLARASCLHSTSEQEANNLQRFGLDVPVAIVANGVDIPGEQELAKSRAIARFSEEKIALFLGRLYPVKGLPMLLEAWSRVRPEGWKLRIAGPDEDSHRRVLEDAVLKLGLVDCVSFLGQVFPKDRLRIYAEADLFILPSYSESFGMAVAEALAHGLPVLTTTGAPWSRLLALGCGWREDPTVDGLCGALWEATSCSSATLQEMGAKGRAYVAAEFGWSAIAQRMIALYREVLADTAFQSASTD